MENNPKKQGRYTQYINKIGLHNSTLGFIKNNTEVVLQFPFKDTLLEAGMSKEDKNGGGVKSVSCTVN